MKDKIFAIVNPVSASGRTAKLWPHYQEQFDMEKINIASVYTDYPGHAAELVRQAITEGYIRIMAVGGDGTVNEVVNGFVENDKLVSPAVELIVFSQGTGCDFIKSLGIKRGFAEIVSIIKKGSKKYFDLGCVTYISFHGKKRNRYFVNLADVGIGAETVQLVNNSTKIFGGFLTYLTGALRTILKYNNKNIRLKVDGEELMNKKINSVMVANGRFFGGGIKIAPFASPENGVFDIVILGDLSKREIVYNLARAYKGKHVSHPKVDIIKGRKIEVESSTKMIVEVDGEIIGYLPGSFQIIKSKLPVLVK
ncbi:MAG: diacylglycerol/lipid kinase family protein [Halothermotrichaceae bacterium]